jgi:hypothetical protein
MKFNDVILLIENDTTGSEKLIEFAKKYCGEERITPFLKWFDDRYPFQGETRDWILENLANQRFSEYVEENGSRGPVDEFDSDWKESHNLTTKDFDDVVYDLCYRFSEHYIEQGLLNRKKKKAE